MKIFIFAFALLFASCTHLITGSEVRIQVYNNTSTKIRDFSVMSETGETIVLVPGSIETKSEVYESEWIGRFRFAVFVGDDIEDLGVHRLKSGSVVARVNEENGKFTLELR